MSPGVSAIDEPASSSTTSEQTGEVTWGAHAIVMRVRIPNRIGMLGEVASTIGAAGGSIGAIDTPEITTHHVTRDISVAVSDDQHGQRVVEAVREIGRA